MGTFWHKPAFTAADRDADGEIRADALRPGIYCEDQAALDQLRRGARVRSVDVTPSLAGGFRLQGQDVFLCTPEQAAAFRATATVTPEESLAEQLAAHQADLEAWARVSESLKFDPIGPDGKVEVMGRDVRPPPREMLDNLARMMGEMTAQEVAEEQVALGTKAARAMARQAMRGMTGEEFGRRFLKHAPAGANRKARRAAAAQGRGRS